nr:MAG TPA: hypothetical protein [Caudoviricetes sp.]
MYGGLPSNIFPLVHDTSRWRVFVRNIYIYHGEPLREYATQ